jgi:hypothetical protein
MHRTKTLCLFITMIYLTACNGLLPQPTLTPTPTFTLTASNTPTIALSATQTNTPTRTLIPSKTITLTSTITPTLKATYTSRPTITTYPTRKPGESSAGFTLEDLPLPTGKPLESWRSIPIMPEALAGDDTSAIAGNTYSFTIRADVKEIEHYYDEQLWLLDWAKFIEGEGAPNSKMLMYVKDNRHLSIFMTIVDKPNRIVLVMFVLL